RGGRKRDGARAGDAPVPRRAPAALKRTAPGSPAFDIELAALPRAYRSVAAHVSRGPDRFSCSTTASSLARQTEREEFMRAWGGVVGGLVLALVLARRPKWHHRRPARPRRQGGRGQEQAGELRHFARVRACGRDQLRLRPGPGTVLTAHHRCGGDGGNARWRVLHRPGLARSLRLLTGLGAPVRS